MLNIVGDSWITMLLASIAIIVAIVVPLILYLLSKQKKKLICKLFPSLSLVDVQTQVKDRIKIYYNEKLVEDLSMTIIKVRNNGNQPIREKDIVKPLEISFSENLTVVDYSVINTEPEDITVNLESNTENNLIRCSFDLLNPNDELLLQFFCLGGNKEPPNINARIEGIEQIDMETIGFFPERKYRVVKFTTIYTIIIGFGVIIFSWLNYFMTVDLSIPIAVLGTVFGFYLILIGFSKKGALFASIIYDFVRRSG